MAIGALNQALVDAVMKGHFEFGSFIKVASIAELRLGLHQQEFLGLGVVRGMAGNTAHIVLRVYGVDGIHVLRVARMARHAPSINLFGRSVLEREDFRDIAAARNVGGPGTMARFASLMRRTASGIECCLPVRRLLPAVVDILVAGLADFGAHVVGLRGTLRGT
jgi:hypothetical protein